MGRPRRQEPRRAHLVAAAQRVLARDGLVGLRVRAVALEAGVSPASVVYYYPDTFTLAVEALTLSVREAATERAAVAASVPDPRARLWALVDLDLGETVPALWRAFYEIPGQVPEHPELAAVMEALGADRVAALTAVIEDGVAAGAFAPAAPASVIAQTVSAVTQCANISRWCALESSEQSRERIRAVIDAMVGTAPSGTPPTGTAASTAPAVAAGARR